MTLGHTMRTSVASIRNERCRGCSLWSPARVWARAWSLYTLVWASTSGAHIQGSRCGHACALRTSSRCECSGVRWAVVDLGPSSCCHRAVLKTRNGFWRISWYSSRSYRKLRGSLSFLKLTTNEPEGRSGGLVGEVARGQS